MVFNLIQQKAYWQNEAKRSLEVCTLLFQKNKRPEALFFGHLALEKLLKALVVDQIQTFAPPIHDLQRLAKQAGLIVSQNQQQELKLMTTFNIAGRYDSEKLAFRKRCTGQFTKKYFQLINHYYQWLKKELSRT